MSDHPRCPMCNKKVPRRTQHVYVPKEPRTAKPVKGWEYTGNQIITSRRYFNVAADDRRLHSLTVWDGETYFFRYGFFCTITCAARYGRTARMLKIRDAL